MADHRDVDKVVDEAEQGNAASKSKAACAAASAKVARQPEGSARRRIAAKALARCHAAQTTDTNNE